MPLCLPTTTGGWYGCVDMSTYNWYWWMIWLCYYVYSLVLVDGMSMSICLLTTAG